MQEEELVIRNTFLNAQNGQIVQYGQMGNLKPKDKTIHWIDLPRDSKKGDESTPKSPTQSLAKLIPIQTTINFTKKVTAHHSKKQKDITSALRGTKLNK